MYGGAEGVHRSGRPPSAAGVRSRPSRSSKIQGAKFEIARIRNIYNAGGGGAFLDRRGNREEQARTLVGRKWMQGEFVTRFCQIMRV